MSRLLRWNLELIKEGTGFLVVYPSDCFLMFSIFGIYNMLSIDSSCPWVESELKLVDNWKLLF